MNKMNLIFLGSPGVGKGTYANVLKEILKIPQVAASELLKKETQKDSRLSKEILKIMAEGGLVGDDIIFSLIKNRLSEDDCKKGFILDGFPRNVEQAEQLITIPNLKIDYVFNFMADDEVIITRLSGRLICQNCKSIFHKTGIKTRVEGICDNCNDKLVQREDDKPEKVRHRLEVYKEKTLPLVDYYKKQDKLVEIVINQEFDLIKDKLIETVKKFFNGEINTIGEIRV